jgi:hypothetical protein
MDWVACREKFPESTDASTGTLEADQGQGLLLDVSKVSYRKRVEGLFEPPEEEQRVFASEEVQRKLSQPQLGLEHGSVVGQQEGSARDRPLYRRGPVPEKPKNQY